MDVLKMSYSSGSKH